MSRVRVSEVSRVRVRVKVVSGVYVRDRKDRKKKFEFVSQFVVFCFPAPLFPTMKLLFFGIESIVYGPSLGSLEGGGGGSFVLTLILT